MTAGSKKTPQSFEDVLELIRPWGWWQTWICIWVAYLQFWEAQKNLSVIFFQISADFTCTLPVKTNWTFEQMKNISSPIKLDASGEEVLDPCKIYPYNYETLSRLSFDEAYAEVQNADKPEPLKCTDFTYDIQPDDMSVTIVTQYDLVCDRQWDVAHTQLVFMFGFLVGSALSGPLSDAIGRKTTMVSGAVLSSILGFALGYAPSYMTFLALRFFASVVMITRNLAAFCLVQESTTSRYRIWVGGCFYIPFGLGYTALAGIAYLTRDWRLMNAWVAGPCFLALVYWWLIPESPRWLLVKGKVEKAEAVLQWANRWNKGCLPENADLKALSDKMQNKEAEEHAKRTTIFHIFEHVRCGQPKYPTLIKRALVIFFNWFVIAMVYYGVSLNVSSFGGNKFINNAISGAVEIPATLLCAPLLAWSRRKSMLLTLFVGGVSLFIVPWIPAYINALKLTFAMLGKFGITASFGIIYVYTTELYPTVIRTSGLAASSMVARFGSMLAPYISEISRVVPSYGWIPMMIFGSLSLAAGFAAMFLPETAKKQLPDRLEDAAVRKFKKETMHSEQKEEKF